MSSRRTGKTAGTTRLQGEDRSAEATSHAHRDGKPSHARRTKLVHLSALVLAFVVAVFSAGWGLRSTLKYGVSVPFWDQWDYIEVLRKYASGEISLGGLLLMRAAEHQISGMVLLSSAQWHLGNMHLKGVMVWNWLLLVTFCALATAVTAKELGRKNPISWLVLAASTFFAFNPAAYQMWLWSVPHHYVLVMLAFVVGVVVIQSNLSIPTKLAGITASAFFASYLLGNGLLLWFVLPLILLLYEDWREVRARRIVLALSGALFAFTTGCYVYGVFSYESPAPPPSGSSPVLDVINFFLVLTGNFISLSLSPHPVRLAQGAGVLLIALFLGAGSIAFLRSRARPERRIVLIWISIGGICLFSSFLTSIARYGFGIEYPLDASRYVLASSFLPVAAVVLSGLALRSLVQTIPRKPGLYAGVLCGLIVLCSAALAARVPQTSFADRLMKHTRFEELHAKVAIASAGYLLVPEYRNVFPVDTPVEFRKSLPFLQSMGWIDPPAWDEKFLRGLGSVSTQKTCGTLDSVLARPDSVEVSGWAFLSDRSERAHGVILVGFDAGKRPELLGVTFTSVIRPDVAAALQDPEALASGWKTTVPSSRMGGHSRTLRAFGYDAESGQACALSGSGLLP